VPGEEWKIEEEEVGDRERRRKKNDLSLF